MCEQYESGESCKYCFNPICKFSAIPKNEEQPNETEHHILYDMPIDY